MGRMPIIPPRNPAQNLEKPGKARNTKRAKYVQSVSIFSAIVGIWEDYEHYSKRGMIKAPD
jgi:hypothetical protein